MKVDLHVHSYYSRDSLASPQTLVEWMTRRGLDALAITDHNEIQGALEAIALAPGKIIIGEEILTSQGEIIGLFLQEYVPPHLSPAETVARIHRQGGLVYIPHPTDSIRRSTLRRQALLTILPEIDALEGYNARALCDRVNRASMHLAQTYNLPMGAGSDAHRARDVGLAYVEMPPFHDAASFLEALSQGQLHGRITSPIGKLASLHARLLKRFANHP